MKNTKKIIKAVLVTAFLLGCNSQSTDTKTADTTASHEGHSHMNHADTTVISAGQEVFFDQGLKDGDVVKSPLTVHFGVKGMKVLPADSGIVAQAGHHHLLVDTLNYVQAGTMVPMGVSNVLHFGKGQLQSKPLDLKKGEHTLTLQFANGMHMSYGIKMSKTIRVTVK